MTTHRPSTPLTLEQATEALDRFRSYAIHCYFAPDAHDRLKAHTVTHEGRTFSTSVRDDGKIVLTTTDGMVAVYDVLTVLETPRETARLDHFGYRFTILNKAELSETDIAYAKDVGWFVLSYTQRNLAFQFFARMGDETLALFAKQIAEMTPIIATEEPVATS